MLYRNQRNPILSLPEQVLALNRKAQQRWSFVLMTKQLALLVLTTVTLQYLTFALLAGNYEVSFKIQSAEDFVLQSLIFI